MRVTAALLGLLLLMAPQAEARVVNLAIGERAWAAIQSSARFTDIEGAFRSAKTWSALIAIRLECEQHPGKPELRGTDTFAGSGIRWAIARWTEDDLHQKLIPDYRQVCALLHLPVGEWNSRENCFDLPNGSRVYAVHLKTSQVANRYAKIRGLTVAGFYIDQLEEVPEDVYEEAALRLSQPGFPQRMLVTPNPVPETHWIARKWPVKNTRQDHAYFSLSIWDNAHNLAPETIRAAETLYPEGHPARRTKLEGRRGLDVRGTPVYVGAFSRSRHVTPVAFTPELALLESYDYGFHHPAVVFGQTAPWGWLRILGGIMGQDLHLDEFLPIVERYRAKWFSHEVDGQLVAPTFIQSCGDPAGANENSQGLRGKPISLLRGWYREHGKASVVPQFKPSANHPEHRRAAIDTAATYMRHQSLKGKECFLVDPERWVLATRTEVGLIEERYDSFFVDGLELGYVLEGDARHSTRLGTFHVPVKDGWFEHGQNCFEYLMQQFVPELPAASARAPEQHRQWLIEVERAARAARQQAFIASQRDDDEEPIDGTVPAVQRPEPLGRSRAGY